MTYDTLNRKTNYTYDLNGNMTSIIDPQGNPTLFEYEPVYNKVSCPHVRGTFFLFFCFLIFNFSFFFSFLI
ncbi:MAG: RHS repeat protein [Nitrospirae bacterium]|nr:RHS repeat protein [Nitrospirota bacterium]